MLDPDTTTFLTTMRESIEGKIDAQARESRESVHRVETLVSNLSREIGETTVALQGHVTEDTKIHKGLEDDIQNLTKDNRSRLERAMPTLSGTSAAALIVAVAEWFRSSGQP